MATTSERQEQFRQGRLAAGYRRECFWLDAAAQNALKQLRALHPDQTRDGLVNQALTGLLEHNNSALDTNSKMPVDRAELAAVVRSWRGQGMTLEQVATRLNEAGWTPSAIPAKRATSDQWNFKTVSQLLNRDYKAD